MNEVSTFENDGVDWNYWGKMAYLRPFEAARLLLRMDPDRVTTDDAKQYPAYKSLSKILYREHKISKDFDQDVLFELCDNLNIEVPDQMRRAYTELHPPEMPPRRAVMMENRHLKAEIQRLRREANTRNITKILIIFYAMCRSEPYGYDPEQKKNATTSTIMCAVSDLDEEDRLNVSENTVRAWIAKAKERTEEELTRIKRKEQRQKRGARADAGRPVAV